MLRRAWEFRTRQVLQLWELEWAEARHSSLEPLLWGPEVPHKRERLSKVRRDHFKCYAVSVHFSVNDGVLREPIKRSPGLSVFL